MIRRTLLSSLLLTIAIAPGCSSKSAGNDAAQPVAGPSANKLNIQVNPSAKIATKAQADAVKIDPKTFDLTFPAAGNDDLATMQPGQIFVGDRRSGTDGNNLYGFMRKVSSVEKSGGNIIVHTTDCYLSEVIAGDFDLFQSNAQTPVIDTTGTDFQPILSGSKQPAVKTSTGGSTTGPGSHVDITIGKNLDWSHDFGFDKTYKLLDVNQSKTFMLGQVPVTASITGDLTADTSFHFNPDFNIGGSIDIGWTGVSVKEFHVSAKGTVLASVIVNAQAMLTVMNGENANPNDKSDLAEKVKSLVGSNQFTTTIFQLPPIAGPGIGPIPTTWNFSIDLSCGVNIAGHAQGQAGFKATATAELGAKYENGNGWNKISSFSFDNQWVGPTVTAGGSATAKCDLIPKLEVLLAGAAGPYILVDGYVQATGSYDETCSKENAPPDATAKVSLDAGIDVKVGGEIKAWKFDLANFDYDLYSNTWNLAEKDFMLTGIGYCGAMSAMGTGGSGGAGGSGTGGSGGDTSTGGSGGDTGTGGASGSGGSGTGGTGGAGGSGPSTCGDGVLEGNEQCDGSNLGGKTCADALQSIGATGTLACSPNCTFDASGCSLPGGGGACHDVCTESDMVPMKTDCSDPCVGTVCMYDSYCCTVGWDLSCLDSANQHCGTSCPL